ncbi:TolC family protein [Gammaproteobacteria bacterium LSUCC0112]|nr:TolC family protein [Gammaproteobacteria bacterium LSUCC0112]
MPDVQQYRKTPSRPVLLSRTALGVAILLAMTACAGTPPRQLSETDVFSQSQIDLAKIRREVIPIQSELTLEEAQARALKYNLELRTAMMEEALQRAQLDVSNYDMLPTLLAQAGYNTRSNERISQSRDSESGELSPSRFISQEREHWLSQLGVSWSLLDLGVGYYTAQQQADRALIAFEKRRKVLHLLLQDVHIAFWRAASAQVMQERVQATIVIAEKALAEARIAQRERIDVPQDGLRYQRQLLENLRLLEAVSRELSNAQVELAQLVNAPIGQAIRVEEPERRDYPMLLSLPVETLEEMTLSRNPDIVEQQYNARIARVESRKTLVQMFPNLNFDYGVSYDDDRYLVNNHWSQASAQLSFNFFNLLTAPAQMRLADAGIALADQRRAMVQMAALTQLHLSRLEYANAIEQLERSRQIWDVDTQLLKFTTDAVFARTESQLNLVSSETSAILSELRLYQANAQSEAAAARMLYTLGVEPQVGSVSELSLEELVEQLRAESTLAGVRLNEVDPGSRPPEQAGDTVGNDVAQSDLVARTADPIVVTPTAFTSIAVSQTPVAPVIAASDEPAVSSSTVFESTDNTTARLTALADALESWRQDWASKNNEAYLSHYAEHFSAENDNKASWSSYKSAVNNGKTFINVEIEDTTFDVDPEDSTLVTVRFYQRYESNNYTWNGWKEQIWQKMDSAWKITYEGEV